MRGGPKGRRLGRVLYGARAAHGACFKGWCRLGKLDVSVLLNKVGIGSAWDHRM